MEGSLYVDYSVSIAGEEEIKASVFEIISDEKISKLIKSAFGKGIRGAELLFDEENMRNIFVAIGKKADVHTIELPKKDFADALTFAEEDAQSKGLMRKKDACVTLLNLRTAD